MTTPKIIRGIEGEAYDRWQIPAVDAAAIEEPEEIVPSPGPTVRELERLQQAAYEEGFDEGRAAGLEQGRSEGHSEGFAAGEQEGRELVMRMRQIFDALTEPVRQLDDSVEQALAQLAMSLAEQIIHHELTVQAEEILAVVREAVALLPLSGREVSVRLHPDDARFLRETLRGSDEESGWNLIDDPSLSRGGCHVVSGNSQIDVSLERRVALLAESVLGSAAGKAEEPA